MGKFDGILLATDWDGTFFHNNRLFDENLKAIKYFVDNGGYFTVCSGRYPKFLKQYAETVHINTYAVCYNGALIVDLYNDRVLYESFCDSVLFDIIDMLFSSEAKYKTINVHMNDGSDVIDLTIEEFCKLKDFFKTKSIYKVLLKAENPIDAENGVRIANELDLCGYIAVRSWDISLEILKRENAKGASLRRIADEIGAKLVVAVGDYENDIDLIRAADIGYAVQNAIGTLKDVADRITVDVTEAAIAHIIYDLERDINNNH